LALDVDRIDVEGVWYRHLPHRGSVWWRSEPPPDGRWQRGAAVAGFYLADSRETAWAEWYRQIDELALRPDDQLPRDLWRFGWPGFQKIGEQLHAEGSCGPSTGFR
jgi:hypothetical protein